MAVWKTYRMVIDVLVVSDEEDEDDLPDLDVLETAVLSSLNRWADVLSDSHPDVSAKLNLKSVKELAPADEPATTS